MTLYFVEKRDRSKIVEELGEQSNIVKAYFSHNAPIDESEAEIALDILEKLLSEGLYVQCDCYPPGEQPAYLYPARPGSLKRLPQPANRPHHRNCPFGQITGAREINLDNRRSERGLAVFGPYLNRGTDTTPTNARRASANSLPKLSQTLFRIIEKAELNVRRPDQPQPPHAVRAWKAAQELHLAPDMPLDRAFGSGDPQRDSQGIARISHLKKLVKTRSKWPTGLRPQAYFCGVVQDYRYLADEGCFGIDFAGWQDPQYVAARPHVFGGYVREGKRSPYIGIIGYALPNARSRTTHGLRCFMQPCAGNDDWMPVDSDLERQTFAVLEMFQRRMPWLQIVITKPLFDVRVVHRDDPRKSAYCKPDFILDFVREGELRRVAIETMGLSDPQYEDRKSRTHPLMRYEYGGLIQHRFDQAIDGRNPGQRFSDELLAFLRDGTQPPYETLGRRREV